MVLSDATRNKTYGTAALNGIQRSHIGISLLEFNPTGMKQN
jgi:hypothetical protein